MDLMLVIVVLLGGHALADYPLQGDFLYKAKNKNDPIPGVPWWQAMGAHATIHGSFVALITGIWYLFFAEAILHFVIDTSKCNKKIDYNTDQFAHILCKFLWWFIAIKIQSPYN